jgi:nitroreductase
MDVKQAVTERRSIKKYENHTISEDTIKEIMELVLLSPTSFNIQNWRFVVVSSPEQKKKLREAAFNQAQCEESSFSVIFCADLKAAETDPGRYWKNAPEETQKFLVPMISGFYKDNEALNRDEAMRSTGIAAQTLMLLAKEYGLDTCAMVGFDPAKTAELIALPENHVISMIVTVGKRAVDAYGRSGPLPYDEVVMSDRY